MQIVSIETWLIDIPTRRPHGLSFGVVTSLNYVVVCVRSANGVRGWGEAAVLSGPTWSEESAESIFATLNTYLIPVALGQDASQIEPLRSAWNAQVRGNPFAKAALEIALQDLRARSLGVPLATLLGGIHRRKIPLSWSLGGKSVDEDIREATEMIAAGHFMFKIKVGNRPLGEDLEKVVRLREALGPDVRIRVDANQGWSLGEAFAALDRLQGIDIDFLEQPVAREDIDGMARLQDRSTFPLLADESLTTIREAAKIIERGAARAIALKVTKHGGLGPGMHIATYADAMSIGCYIGCMIETSIGTAAYAHLGAAIPQLDYGCELFGPLMMADDIASTPVRYEPGHVLLPDGAGLGIDVDIDKLAYYTRTNGYTVHEVSSLGDRTA